MSGTMGTIYLFGEWELDTRLYELRCHGKPLGLEPKVFDVLLYLVQHRDRVVSSRDLMEHLWPGQFIGDAALVRCVVAARRAIGDSGRAQRCIKTLRNRGYRFVAPVEERVDAHPMVEPRGTPAALPTPEGPAPDDVRTGSAPTLPSPAQVGPLSGERFYPQQSPAREHRPCPRCRHENGMTASFCGACGTRLPLACPSCGHPRSVDALFCTSCGGQITEPPALTSALPSAGSGDRQAVQMGAGRSLAPGQRTREAERRHLTVLFCDVINATALAVGLDPEVYHEVIGAYHAVCIEVIERLDGHIAQYLGDGVLVYFGYPQAHEDDAQRAVRAGLGIIEALGPLQQRLRQEQEVNLAVRIGIHTGLVVMGDIGEGIRHERLAIGQAPNLAARLQALAAPDTVLISPTTARLVRGWFVCETLGDQTLKGFPEPIPVYRVLAESGLQSRLDIASVGGLTPLVGRQQEVELLMERWEHAKDGLGQVVLLRGEAGIGKSRLVRTVQEGLVGESYARLECRCSPYAQNSALYPLIDLGRHLLHWQRDESPDTTLEKLEAALAPYDVSRPEVVPLLASLLSLPLSERYAPLQLTPQRQKQKTLDAIMTLLLAHAERQPVLFIIEDLHWVDASTLELLTLLVDHGPTARILTLLTSRPEFEPPWGFRGHVTTLTLGRLPPRQVEEMIDRVTEGKRLPAEVRRQVVAKTDGVPLFVEELTKMVLESGLLREQAGRYELTGPLPSPAIPATLHDSLMARLDRLSGAKEVAQLGATLGRTFSYELLYAVSPWDEERLRQALAQLVAADLLHQRGVPPHLTYIFKHALIQETAYQSLLKSRRQQYHLQVVHAMEQQFPDMAETQPELIAYHYTEAGLGERSIPYWQRAGQHAVERSANSEAVSHFTKGLEVLKALPETPEHIQQELTLQLAMGSPLLMLKGHTAPEVEHAYARAYQLAQQLGETSQRFSVLEGLWRFYLSQARLQTARELGERCLTLAQRMQNPALLQQAHLMLGATLLYRGELVSAHAYLEGGIALYDSQSSHAPAFSSAVEPRVACLSWVALALWLLGYPDRAQTRSQEAITLAQNLSHAYSLGFALFFAATVHRCRREIQGVEERAEAVIALSNNEGFVRWLGGGMYLRGWARAVQGSAEEGVVWLSQGLSSWRAMGGELGLPHLLATLADAYRQGERSGEGLRVLDEALALVHANSECHFEAELYRLKGELLLQQAVGRSDASTIPRNTSRIAEASYTGAPPVPPLRAEAQSCFCRALDISRQQHAKSLELRAVMSLARLWQLEGKRSEARRMLAEIYGWFTEGFETPDLQEAKILLQELI
jgi:class 3 adenylate cyclase/DNA-binding winged helix-turn-helix (wHTH) protein/tetratricopeptide (TPR) repeat protein